MPQQPDIPDVGSLTRAIAAGDADAFSSLYTARFDRLYRSIRRTTGLPEQDCLDIAQDAFLRMIRRMKPIDEVQVLDAWMARVARTAAIDHLRAERRRRARESASARPGSLTLAEIDDRLGSLRALDAEQASLLRLRIADGRTLGAVARALGLKPGAVDGRVRRALRDAREALPDE